MSEADPTLSTVSPEERAHRRRLARSTAVFGAATALSRVLGLVREMIAAPTFGAAGKINAFTVAFQIPNLVRALVADTALSGAFVPVFSELLEKGERLRAWRVASTIFWLVLLITTGLTAVFVLIAPLIVELFGTPGGSFDLAVGLSRLLFPIVIMLGLSGIIVGILNAYDHFTVPALTPVAWNLVIIFGLVLGVPAASSEDAQLYIYAGSIVLATLVQLLLPVPWLRGLDGRLRIALDWRDPAVRRFFVLMLPVTLTLGLINVSTLIGTLFASRLIDPDLAPRAIDLAFRLYMLPLAAFSVGLVFNGWMLLLNRAFYGLRMNWIPTLVALGNLVLNVALFFALYTVGVWGLPLATSLSNLAGALALAILMWRHVGGVDTRETLLAIGRIIVASVAASALAVLVWWGVDTEVGRSVLGQILSVGLALGLGTAAYLGVCRILRVRELGSLFALRRAA
jgi:peptidoglycan biosynthesis protein MviN/MurJ (putative lipid II flippase)